jgi:hypothetical protein
MPTLSSEDCVSAGSSGDSEDVEFEGELGPEPALALRWKNEWIGGWYWRLRACSSEVVDGAMVFLPKSERLMVFVTLAKCRSGMTFL